MSKNAYNESKNEARNEAKNQGTNSTNNSQNQSKNSMNNSGSNANSNIDDIKRYLKNKQVVLKDDEIFFVNPCVEYLIVLTKEVNNNIRRIIIKD